MIRIMLIDDHHAIRAGLETVLCAEPDLVPVAATDAGDGLWPRFRRTRPDLVLLDYHLPGSNSLVICRQLKAMVPAPRVVFYSAYADASLAVPLRVAGADGLASKGAPAQELLEVIRRVAGGEVVLPQPTPDVLAEVRWRLDGENRRTLDHLLAGENPAGAPDLDADGARRRTERLLEYLMPAAPARA